MWTRIAAGLLGLTAVVVAGCGINVDDADGLPRRDLASLHDAAAPSFDLLPAGADLGAENAACEAQLAADQAAMPPHLGLGLGTKSAIQSYVSVMGKVMADYHLPGGAVAVTKDGRLVLALGLGMADKEDQQPAHPDDLFRIASLSKQVTATTVLSLVQAGKLSLDDHPFEILSNLAPLPSHARNPDLAKITVRHLLQHTGGWNRDSTFDPMFISPTIAKAFNQPGPADCEMTLRYMLDKPLQYAPGTTNCYSNFGYCVLGRVIAAKTAGTYDAAVRSAVLKPLAAERLILGKTLFAERADGEVRYYDYPGAPQANSVFPSMPGMLPWPYGGFAIEAMDAHGGWLASPVDMLRFQAGVDGKPNPPDVLAPASLAAMLANPKVPSCTAQNGTTPASTDYWYGFGWSVNKYGNYWHTGSLPGTVTEDVIASNGYSWSAFFNSRPNDDTLWSRLDGDLWKALQGTASWLSGDSFDRFGAFSAWLSPADYQAAVDQAAQAGREPARVEGRLQAGKIEYRAQLVPKHPGALSRSRYGMDCLTWRGEDAQWTAAGYVPFSVQSFVDANDRRVYQATWLLP